MKVKAYRIKRPEAGSGWIHCGTTIEEVLNVLESEMSDHESLSADECDAILIEAYETT